MSKKKIKLKFLKNYSLRKKGEVVLLENDVAEFYVSNGFAEISQAPAKSGCTDCNKAKDDKLKTANATIKSLKEELKVTKNQLETELKTANATIEALNEQLKPKE